MITFESIVVPTDFSENAKASLPFATALAKQFNGKIKLVHVFEEMRILGLHGQDVFERFMVGERIARESKLKEIADSLTIQGIETKYCIVEGYPPTEILSVAKAVNADCIVIATHGRTGLAHTFLGSVAERVVRLSHCPVLTVRAPQD